MTTAINNCISNKSAAETFPSVSCCMPTYGRSVQIINEAVKSFIDQDYKGKKELIIYNDHSEIEFTYHHPEVRIYNSKKREPSLGEKYNKTIDYARNEYIIIWDDDDIYLPHRISYSINNSVDGFFIASKYFIYHEQTGTLSISNSNPAASLCARKEQFLCLGGYDHKDKGADLKMALHASNLMKQQRHSMENRDVFYLLKWSPTTRYHHSAVTRRHSDEEARKLIDEKIPITNHGKFNVEPKYANNYQIMIDDFIKNMK